MHHSLCRLKTTFFALSALLFALPQTLRADDAAAWKMVKEANQCSDDAEGLGEAFVLLYDAFGTAHTQSTQQSIQQKINNIYTQYTNRIRNNHPSFLDAASTSDSAKKLYDRLASFNDARGKRLLGEYMLENGDEDGWDSIEEAAALNEPRALFLLADRYKMGLGGARQDPARAWDNLWRSAQGGYAPAYEMLAQVCWDGDGNFGSNVWNQQQAIRYLDEAIRLYSAWTLWDKDAEARRKEMLSSLNIVRSHMVNLSSGNIRLPERVYLSYMGMLLISYNDETEAGLRARAYHLCRLMDSFPGTYLTGRFDKLKLEQVSISVGACNRASWIGQCTGEYPDDDTFSIAIRIDVSRFPANPGVQDEASLWYARKLEREMKLNDTLAHELAHGYFHARYPKISSFSENDSLLTYEGHATNAAYAVTRTLYYSSNDELLTQEQYTQHFCSPEYGRYFRWFRNYCMSPSGLVYWDKIDGWEESSDSNHEQPRQRQQVPYQNQTWWKPTFFHRGFYGYM